MELREELPWLAGDAVLAANQAAAGGLAAELRDKGFSVVELEGERIVSDESFFDVVGRVFGPTTATVEDWMGVAELIVEAAKGLGPRSAVVWQRADASAHFSLRTVAEAVIAMMRARERLLPDVTLELVLLGPTRDFPHPGQA